MASSFALKKLLASNLLTRSLVPFRLAAAAGASSSRFLNTKGFRDHDSEDDCIVEVDCRRSIGRSVANRLRSALFSFIDAFHPFSPTRNLNSMDGVIDTQTFVVGSAPRHGWDVKENAEALCLLRDMPGLGKEDVKVSVKKDTELRVFAFSCKMNIFGYERRAYRVYRAYRVMLNPSAILVIKHEGRKGSEDEDDARRYTIRIDLPGKIYKTNDIKIDEKNGVLKVTVPKVKVKMIDKITSTIE